MEKRNNRCLHCHQSFQPCRNPQQRYCSQRRCQNSRKGTWRKQKYAMDEDYRVNQRRANQRWQQSCVGYWHRYRASHPEYVQRNREAVNWR